ncbi:MAG: OmpA family protein [Bacteroidetes bacterium]|nr:OmpA family protein [Bacteroidota bacterium]
MEFIKSSIQQLMRTLFLCFALLQIPEAQSQQSFYCKERLPDIVNSYYKTLLPVLHPSGSRLYFVRKEHPGNIGGIKDPDDIWYADRLKDNYWSAPVNAGPSINTPYSNALFSITADGNSAFVASVSEQGVLSFHMAQLHGNSWTIGSPFEIQDFAMNSPQYFANMNADQNVLILAMNHNGALGDLDLYVSIKSKSGIWSTPLWMGDNINSSFREGSPFLARDNKTLYFYSNGFGGYGGSDLFMSRRLDDTWQSWSKPLNLGPYINTPANERSITLTSRGDTACIISTDSSNDQEGMYFVCLQEDIRPQQKQEVIPLGAESSNLSQSEMKVEIYFLTDKSTLTTEHISQLQELCQQVQDKNKHIIIRGFTDDTGSTAYNKKLSLKRAHSVGEYLKKCGMKSHDLIGDGIRDVQGIESVKKRRDMSRAVEIFLTIQQ